MNYIYYIYLGIAAICIMMQFCLSKIFQVKYECGSISLFFRSILTGLICVLLFLVLTGFKMSYSNESLIFSIIIASISIISNILGVIVVRYGEIAIYTMFMMLGGMVLPYLHGIIFLKETPSIWCIIGIIVLVLSLILSSAEKLKSKSSNRVLFTILCILVFLLNGFMSIFSKLSRITDNAVPIYDFLVLENGVVVLFSLIIFIVLVLLGKKRHEEIKLVKDFNKKNLLFMVILIISTALISTTGYLFQLIGAEHLPSTVLYPIVSGGSICLTSIAGRILFKEKISILKWISIGMTLAGTILFLF
mgnify:CR=1 FL=1